MLFVVVVVVVALFVARPAGLTRRIEFVEWVCESVWLWLARRPALRALGEVRPIGDVRR